MQDRIRALAAQYHSWVVGLRRHLHAHPELSGHEQQTQAFITTQLDSLGIPYQPGIGGGYSVIAEIRCNQPELRRVALRGDTDALPILEGNDVPYKSTVPGVFHGCGHDAHTSNLLGVARILNDLRHELTGTFVLIFQPHEEKLPGGAVGIVQAGVLEGVSACIGLHVDPNLPVGTVGFKSGEYMSSVDELYVTIAGKSCHGGSGLHLGVDPILASAHLLLGIEQIKTRNTDARKPMVISFGQIQAGAAPNVIPDTLRLSGTLRTMHAEVRELAHQRLLEVAEGVSKSTGAHIDMNIVKGHPVLVNHPELTTLVRQVATDFVGADSVKDLSIWMASEDFSHYCLAAPSCFFRLGVRNEAKGIVSGLHNSTFNLDEDALLTGMTVMSLSAVAAMGAR